MNVKNATAIKVENVSKRFKIPHEKINSVKGAFVSAFKKKNYEEFQALDNVSFEVKKGEFFGIIGRNGSGKSTLLKILAGIYKADKGKVEVNGGISPFLELGIGFNPELSGRDNIYLNATVLGLSKKEIDEKFDSIVKFSELERFIDQKLKNYSSGMQVRLAFSVSIHANRDILLMDEVLAVGDNNFQQKCLREFNRYKEMGKTVILVTHDINIVQRYCDRALLLQKGRIALIGNSTNVIDKYIKQNMSDEEKRLHEETKAKEENFKGTKKEAYIENILCLDSQENEKKIFRDDEDVVIRVKYKANKKIEKPVFGISIYTQDGNYIAGPNTKTSNFDLDEISGEGYLDFIIPKNPFFTGEYLITAAIFNWECITPFDYQDKKYSFNIVSDKENQYGFINLKHIWKKS